MGNEKSALNGLEIDEKSVEVTDFWVHYTARVNGYGAQRVSLFVSEPSLHYSANFGNPSPLEKAAKVNVNLFITLHPYVDIIRFHTARTTRYHLYHSIPYKHHGYKHHEYI